MNFLDINNQTISIFNSCSNDDEDDDNDDNDDLVFYIPFNIN